MTDELKPCPFCGGNNLKSGGDDKTVGTWCLDCQATGPNHYGEHEWNTRAPVRVKKLVWVRHPKGFMASTVGLGPAYIFQLSGSRYECIKGLYGSPRFDTSDEAKAAAQRDFNARILECLE